MTYPIQRQGETYGIFDEGDLRFAKEHTTRDLPSGLANMLGGPRITAGMHDTRYDPRVDGYPEPYGEQPSLADLQDDGPYQMSGDDFDAEYPNGEPQHENYDAFREQPQAPLQPLNEMLEHTRRPDMPAPPHDYLAQFRPHLASFTEARHLMAGGPAPSTIDKTALAEAPAQPQAPAQAVPGWIGHGYAPGHRVGLPWREQVIPGTVTHLDGPEVGIRWDDGQHSTEEPSDLRPL